MWLVRPHHYELRRRGPHPQIPAEGLETWLYLTRSANDIASWRVTIFSESSCWVFVGLLVVKHPISISSFLQVMV